MTIRYTLTKQELWKGAGESYDYRMKWRKPLGLVLGLLFLLFGLYVLIDGQARAGAAAFIILGIYLFVRRYIWIYRSVRNSSAGKQDQERVVTAKVGDEGIEMETSLGHGIAKWGAFVDFHPTKDGLLLYPAKNMYYWIPKDSDIDGGDWPTFTKVIAERVRVKI